MAYQTRPASVRFWPLALGVLALLGGGLFALARAQTDLDPDGLLAQLAAQPKDVSIVAYGVRPDGTPDPDQPSVLVNPDQPMPLASSRKIVLLAAYARAVAEQKLDPAQPVKLADWEAYYLPRTDGGAHPEAVKRLNIRPGGNTTLDQIAGAMIRESDNAAADYLYLRVGPEAVQAVIRDAGLNGQEPLFPISGEFRTYGRGLAGATLKLSREAFRAEALRRTPAPDSRPPLFVWLPTPASQARLADAFTVRGTTRDYAGLMARVMTGTFLSKTVSAVMARHLEWHTQSNPGTRQNFEQLGAKGGSLPGIYTNNFYLLPKVGPAKGQRRVVSLFMRRIPEALYAARTGAGETFLLMTAIRADFAAKVKARLGGSSIEP